MLCANYRYEVQVYIASGHPGLSRVQLETRVRRSYLFLLGLVRGPLAVPGSGLRSLKTHLSRTCFGSMWRPLVACGNTKTRRTIIDVTWLREYFRLVVRLPALTIKVAAACRIPNCYSNGIAAWPLCLHVRTCSAV
jgi:hypothetical protein